MKSFVVPFLLAVLVSIQLFPLGRSSEPVAEQDLQALEAKKSHFPAPIQSRADSVQFMLMTNPE